MGRTVIIGLDGVPFRVMDTLSAKEVMPNFKKLKEQGSFKKFESAIPDISSVAWSSIITGTNPGEHGIFGFTDLVPGTYNLTFPNFTSLKAKPFWHQKPDKKYVIINVPSTFPAQPLNGFLVSGFVSLDLQDSVYPQEFIPDLEEIGYKIDVDSAKGHTSKEEFIKDLFDTLNARIETYRMLWDEFDWDVFMFIITGTDRVGHFLMDAFEDENHPHHKDFLEYFKKADEAIGEITSRMNEDDSLIMLSDHGMETIDFNVYVNAYLKEKGFLELNEGSERITYNDIAKGTKAFAMDPGRIYVNLEGKYPNGSIKPEEKDKVIAELIELFQNMEKDGKKIIKSIHKKDEIYQGPVAEQGPDLVLLSNKGFNLKGSIAKSIVFDKDVFTGKHTQDDAFLLVKTAKDIKIPEKPKVSDVVSIMNQIED
ncbi:alkaline phosphatase family protein [Candidatus Woesearchaeota archaeon]|nr:alkaline phosphatase family protein [Candidatus Woesearchaeota archaeon]